MDDQQPGHPVLLCKARCANNSPCLNYANKDGYCWRHHPQNQQKPQEHGSDSSEGGRG